MDKKEPNNLLPQLYKEEDEKALNNNELIEKRIAQIKRALKEEMNLPESAEIIDITFYGDIPLGGQLSVENCYALTIKDGENQYDLLTKEDYSKIATVDKYGELELAEEYKSKLLQGESIDLQSGETKGLLGLPGHQTEEQKLLYDWNEKYYLEGQTEEQLLPEAEQEEELLLDGQTEEHKRLRAVKKEEKEDEKLKKEVARSLGEEPDGIISMIEIKDKKEFSKIFNKGMSNTTTVYLVRYKNDKFNLVEKNADGKFGLIKGLEVSGLAKDIASELKVDRESKNQKIEKGRVLAKSTIGGVPEKINDGELEAGDNFNNIIVIRKPGIERPNVAIQQDTKGNVSASLITENGDKENMTSMEQVYPSDVTLAKQSKANEREPNNISSKLYEYELYQELLRIEEQILSAQNSTEIDDSVLGAIGGAATGAVVGTLAGPVGTGVGAVAGGIKGAEEYAQAARENKEETIETLESEKSKIIYKLNDYRKLNIETIKGTIEEIEGEQRMPGPRNPRY